MAGQAHPRVIRRELPGGLSPLAALALLRDDAHPFALVGDWTGGGVVVGSEPTAQAGPPLPLSSVLAADLEAGDDRGPVPGIAGFGGGWIGYLGYLAGGQARPASAPGGPRRLAAWWFGYYDHVLVRADAGRWFFEALVTPQRADAIEARYRELTRRMQSGPPRPVPYQCGEFTLTPAAQAHVEAVRRAVALIHQGDMFQANITLRLEAGFSGDPLDLFCQGAQALRPPYAAFLRPPGGAVASFSPELFLRRTGRTVLTSPIKGTSSRSGDAAQAARQRDALTGSAKNRAENVMIVDLMRSDLGRVCRPGTVTVPRLAAAEPHPGLWHLVSDVRGELAAGHTDADLVAAAFPPGSVTGAPKVRAMEVIHELETTPREVYTGAIGYRSAIAGLGLNVAIRTFEFAAGRVWLGAGGGIVADSDPAAEFAECLLKSRPLIEAVGGRLGSEPGPDSLDGAEGAAGPAGPRASADAGLLALRPRPAAGVFTTLRVSSGAPDGLTEHLARLDASARQLFGKQLPAELTGQIDACLAGAGSGRLRITVRPRGGPLHCLVELTEAGRTPAAARLRPVTVTGGLGGHKWADRRLLAELAGPVPLAPDEQLLLADDDGSLLETDRANLFAVVDGILRTPAADGRILPGVTRARVLAAARRTGLAVRCGPVRRADLRAASEVFVTNAVRGLVPVAGLSEPPQNWPPGPAVASLRAAIAALPAEQPGWERARPVAHPRRPAGASRGRPSERGPSIVLLDNYDSFTYNLAHLLLAAGCQVEVVRNDEVTAAEVAGLRPAGIVISPGPCAPADAGNCVDVIRALGASTPVLGVCLGHEAIAAAYGGTVEQVAPVHGKASAIEHDGLGIFAGLPPGFTAGRYHSLAIAERTLPGCLTVSARTADGVPMAIRHRSHPVDGVQFHPESILTDAGRPLIGNFLRRVAVQPRQAQSR